MVSEAAGTPVSEAVGPVAQVGALKRGLDILDMYTRSRDVVGIGEMAAELGIHKSSASRLAATLAASGYLRPAGSLGSYRLGARIAALGPLAASDLTEIAPIVMPYLDRLTEITGETGHLAVLDGTDTRTIGIADGWHTVRMHSWVGKESPAYCSSMGKALLAGLSDTEVAALYASGGMVARTANTLATVPALLDNLSTIRSHGFGLDDEELEYGLRCISAPIFTADGRVDASISISGPTQRVTPERVELLERHVRWAAWRASVARGAVAVPAGWAQAPAGEPETPPWVDRAATPAQR